MVMVVKNGSLLGAKPRDGMDDECSQSTAPHSVIHLPDRKHGSTPITDRTLIPISVANPPDRAKDDSSVGAKNGQLSSEYNVL